MSNRFVYLLVAGWAAILPAGAGLAAEAYKTAITAEAIRNTPVDRALKVEFDGIPGPTEQMRAIFNQELERRGYRLDPVSETVMTVRWNGPFREIDKPVRFQAQARGGSESKTELGFSILLGAPRSEEGESTYSIGASVDDGAGQIWKGKVIAVTASQQKSNIMRQMIQQLLDRVGGTFAPTGSDGAPAN